MCIFLQMRFFHEVPVSKTDKSWLQERAAALQTGPLLHVCVGTRLDHIDQTELGASLSAECSKS